MERGASRREQLYEQYEEALFSLMLDEVMEREGDGFLRENEQMKKDGAFSPDRAFDERCLKTIRKHDGRCKRKTAVRTAKKIVVYVSVFFLISVLALAVPFATVSAFRAASLNLIIDIFDRSTRISTDDFHISGDLNTLARYPTWLPPGSWRAMVLTNDAISFCIDYMDQDSNEIYYYEAQAEGSASSIDTENAEIITDIAVNGNEALMSVKKGQIILVWVDDNRSTICELGLHGSETICTPEIALRIAESFQ